MTQQNQLSVTDVVNNMVRGLYKLQETIEQLANENQSLKNNMAELEKQKEEKK